MSRNNGTGLSVVIGGGIEPSCQVLGGYYSDNTAVGIFFGDAVAAQQSRLSSQVQLSGNGAPFSINDGVIGQFDADPVVTAPPPLPSGTAVTNPFPFPVNVFIDGSDVYFILLAGFNLGPAKSVLLPPGKTIQVNYGAAPAFTWVRA